MGLSGRPVEEKKAQPATSPNSLQEYSPTITGKTVSHEEEKFIFAPDILFHFF